MLFKLFLKTTKCVESLNEMYSVVRNAASIKYSILHNFWAIVACNSVKEGHKIFPQLFSHDFK